MFLSTVMKPISILSSAAIITGLAFGFVHQASATTFKFDWDRATDGNHLGESAVQSGHNQRIWTNNSSGTYESLTTSYNDETNRFNFSASFSDNGDPIDGGWVVISNGPNPKYRDKQFAIFYIDADNNQVSAYAYNGQNNWTSYQTNEFLDSWDDILTYESEGGKTAFRFSLDATEINNKLDTPGWKGTQFGEQVGIWFHAGKNTNVSYDYDEETGDVVGIQSFSTHAHWYDTNALDTEAVPEPASLLGLGLVGGAFAVSRRRHKKGQLAQGETAIA